MNENELYFVKEYKFDNPIITEIDSIKDKCVRDYHISFFHKFKYECIYDIKFTDITNNEIINLTISGKSLGLFEINEKLTVARQNGFISNRIKTLKKILFLFTIYKHKISSKVPNTDMSLTIF